MHRSMPEKMRRIAPWLVLAAVYAVMVCCFALYGAHNLNADDSSEMVLAAHLNEQGKFLSEDWLYSTELRVISPVPLYQLGLRLFDSWHAARTFAQAVVLLGIAASALFLAYEAGVGWHAPFVVSILLMPFSFEYAYIMLLGCYYSVHMILSFVILGLTLRVGKRGAARSKAELALLAALGLLSGVGGLRMLTMLIVPLCLAAVILALCEYRRQETFARAAREPAVRMAAAALVNTLCAGIGYVINTVMLETRYSFESYDGLRMGRLNITEFDNQINGIIRTFGYRDNSLLFSAQGLGCWIALLLFALVILALCRLFVRRRTLSVCHSLIALTSVCAIAEGMLLNVFLGQLLVRYFIIGTMLAVFSLFVTLETGVYKNGFLKLLAVLFVFLCFAYQSVCTLCFDFNQGEVNYEMAADWLAERGYTQGYATFWNANTIAEASDGEIEMWVLADNKSVVTQGDWAQMSMQKTLQDRRHLTEEPEGRVFLLVDELEYGQGSPLLDEKHFVDMVAWSYYIYEYESVDEMKALLAAAE